jgi:hypothetical protein
MSGRFIALSREVSIAHVGSSRNITSDDGRTIDPFSRAVTIRELTSDEDAIGCSALFFRLDA